MNNSNQNQNSVSIGRVEEGDHICEASSSGEWIVFTCPVCPGYERRVNKKTGEMETKGTAGNPFTHHGSFIKPGLDALNYTPN